MGWWTGRLRELLLVVDPSFPRLVSWIALDDIYTFPSVPSNSWFEIADASE
jgi:hypothetical protein